jgi:hypothetical protein
MGNRRGRLINRIKACVAILRGFSVVVGFRIKEATLKAKRPYFYNNEIGESVKCNGVPLIESIRVFKP